MFITLFKLPIELLAPLRSPAICLVDAGYPHVFLPSPAQVPQGERLMGPESGPGSKAYADFEVKGMALLAKTCALAGEWEGWTCIPRHLRPTPVDRWFIMVYPIILGFQPFFLVVHDFATSHSMEDIRWYKPIHSLQYLFFGCKVWGYLRWCEHTSGIGAYPSHESNTPVMKGIRSLAHHFQVARGMRDLEFS